MWSFSEAGERTNILGRRKTFRRSESIVHMLSAAPAVRLQSRGRNQWEAPRACLRLTSWIGLSMGSSNRKATLIARLGLALIRPSFYLRIDSLLIQTGAISMCLFLAFL